jgi:adenylate cyclase
MSETVPMRGWIGWGGGTFLALITGLFAVLGPVAGALERFSFDVPLPGHDTHAPTNAVLVYLDGPSFQALGQPMNRPLPRTFHAEVVRRIRADGGRLVVFDLLFHDPDLTPAWDAAFLRVLGERRDVVLAAKREISDQGVLKVDELLEPHPAYVQVAAGVGTATFDQDGDQGVRQLPLVKADRSLPLAAAALKVLGRPVPAVGHRQYLHYYGAPNRLPSVTYASLLQGGVTNGFFRGKVAFVGRRSATTATGAGGDMFVTPYTRDGHSGESPGVSIHATAFLNLLYQDWFTRAPGWVMGVLLLLFAGLSAGLARLSPLRAVGAGAAVTFVLVTTAVILARSQHVWFPWAALLVPLSAGVFWAVVFNGYRSHLDRQLLAQSISKHLSPRRVKQILQHPESLKPGGEMREVSLLFTDIAGFSKVSESKSPKDLILLLNSYYDAAIGQVHAHEGTVLDLVGDAIFALWNAPEDQADHSRLACRSALALQASLGDWDKSNTGAPLRTRAGLHRGEVCVGNVGSRNRFDYTAIGNAVNLASRLEGLNKHLGTQILATREILRDVEDDFLTRLVGRFRFKGKDAVVEVYELLGVAGPVPPWLAEFREALRLFQRKDLDGAEAGFRKVIEMRKEEGVSRFYLDQVTYFRGHPPKDDWLGEVELRDK